MEVHAEIHVLDFFVAFSYIAYHCFIHNSIELRRHVPEHILFVSESGIKNHADIQALRDNGTDAVLIGETLMRATDKKAMLENLKNGTTI